MSSQNLAAVKRIFALSETTSIRLRRASEPSLLGYDALNLLAGRSPAAREKRRRDSLSNGTAPRPIDHRRIYLRRGASRRLSQRRSAAGGRIASHAPKRGGRGSPIYARNGGPLCAHPSDSRHCS